MASANSISVGKLHRLVGTAGSPVILDVRTDDDFVAAPLLIPGSVRGSHRNVPALLAEHGRRPVVVVCQRGLKLSEGVAAFFRAGGSPAEVLEGGFEAWAEDKRPLVPAARLPQRDAEGRTVWVTRARPKIDRIACPWLIRRFVDPSAVFLFVTPSEVAAVAERFAATPFDVPDVFWTHRGPTCTFDTMVEEFGLATVPMLRLASIVRGADTAHPELAPEAPGLLAVSLGLSRMFSDDLEQLAGMLIYDALYRWCRDATEETHSWGPGRPVA